MIQLRDYQQKGVNDIRKFFAKGGHHLLFQSPTGSGKTVIFSYIAQNSALKNKNVSILTNRIELLTQTGGTLKEFGVKPFLITAGTKFISKSSVYVAMSQTLRNRLKLRLWLDWLQTIDLVIIDEAHLQDFNFIFEHLKKKFVIGFSATPLRSGKQRQLGLDYEQIIETVSVQGLIDKGYLVTDDYFGYSGVDLNGIKYDAKKGDYAENDMFQRFNSPKLYAGVVKNWNEVAKDTQTICFCVNIEHTIRTCEEFRNNGIDARFIVSKMSMPKYPKEATQGNLSRYNERMKLYNLYIEKSKLWSGERKQLIDDFKNNKFKVLINAGILTTGFDAKNIQTIIVNRATLSKSLWLQMLGRGSRVLDGKTHFNILDFGDNASRLGHYTAPQSWNLWHEESKKTDGIAPVKECGYDNNGKQIKGKYENKKGCERLIHASYNICPFCGFVYPEKKISEIDLIPVMYNETLHKAVAVKKISQMTITELVEYQKLKKHKQAWLWRQLHYRNELENYAKLMQWKKGTLEKAKNYCKNL